MQTPQTVVDRTVGLDAPFWAALLLGFFTLATLGCFGFAATQASASTDNVGILTTDDCPPPADL